MNDKEASDCLENTTIPLAVCGPLAEQVIRQVLQVHKGRLKGTVLRTMDGVSQDADYDWHKAEMNFQLQKLLSSVFKLDRLSTDPLTSQVIHRIWP